MEWEPRFFNGSEEDPESFSFKLLDELSQEPNIRKGQLENFIFIQPPPHPNTMFENNSKSFSNGL
ncbi:hypothetical protein HMI54_010897 [Coelomomyces lativittatus]|nr:hypothetical protein HMI54_010897 [Coelomomyces lativittatus]